MIELLKLGLSAKNQVPVKVFYEGEEVGNYFADIIVEDLIIVELKAGDGFVEEHEVQMTNYLRSTKFEVGLLLNFRTRARIKRKAFSNEYKTF